MNILYPEEDMEEFKVDQGLVDTTTIDQNRGGGLTEKATHNTKDKVNNNQIGAVDTHAKYTVTYEDETCSFRVKSFEDFKGKLTRSYRLPKEFNVSFTTPATKKCFCIKQAGVTRIVKSEEMYKDFLCDAKGTEIVKIILVDGQAPPVHLAKTTVKEEPR